MKSLADRANGLQACICPLSPTPDMHAVASTCCSLGTLERSITLNFSKPATNIIAQ